MPKTMKKQAKECASCCDDCVQSRTTAERIAEAGIMMVMLVALYRLGTTFDLFSFSTASEDALSLGAVFLIGLTASATSCLAMVGGLLLSVSASWAAAHPTSSRWERFEPQVHFNIGRIVGYFFLGGLTGLLGESILLSVQATGILKVAIALFLMLLGLRILGILPKKYCRIPLPRFLHRRIRALSTTSGVMGTFTLGALTYFVPCGFTQSMQLVALASGSFGTGAMIMTVFALGTLPALVGVGAMSSLSRGKFGRFFFTFAGSTAVLLAVTGLHQGLLLAGVEIPLPRITAVEANDTNVTVDENGQQIIRVGVAENGYSSDSFSVKAGMPTWIYATASENIAGCISSLTIPEFNLRTTIRKGENWVGPFVPTKDFAFMCSMGMFRADVRVRS